MPGLCTSEDSFDVLSWVFDVFDAHDSTEEDILFGITLAGGHDSRAVDQVDPLHECDVLPHFRLPGDGCDGADLFLP